MFYLKHGVVNIICIIQNSVLFNKFIKIDQCNLYNLVKILLNEFEYIVVQNIPKSLGIIFIIQHNW